MNIDYHHRSTPVTPFFDKKTVGKGCDQGSGRYSGQDCSIPGHAIWGSDALRKLSKDFPNPCKSLRRAAVVYPDLPATCEGFE